MLPVTVPTSRRLGRIVFGVLLAGGLLGPPSAFAAPGPNPAAPQAIPPVPQTQPVTWAVTLEPVTLYSGPSDQAVAFGEISAQVTLQVLGYQGDWAHIYNPRSRTEAYVPSDRLGPGEAPSRYITMPPPAPTDEFDARGVVTDGTPLAVYPTSSDEAADGELNPNTWLTLTGTVSGEDGARWYRTSSGDFVPADLVFIPERTEDFTGRWLDVNLNTPSRVTAYEGDAEVSSFLAIRGAGNRPTPSGVFTILRRVANETMNRGMPMVSLFIVSLATRRQFSLQLLEQCVGLPRQPRLPGPHLRRQRLAVGMGARGDARCDSLLVRRT